MTRPPHKRILFCADGHSVHTQEWLRLLAGTDWDVHAFVGGAVPHCRIDATFHTLDAKADNPAANRVQPFWPWRRGVARVCRWRFGSGPDAESRRLAALIRRLRPAIVHSLRLQDEGYRTLGAADAIRDVDARWVVSLWGSDLAHYGRLDGHEEKIRAVLAACDCILADCRRDLALSREFGAAAWKVPFGHAVPGNGGIDLRAIRSQASGSDPVQRRVLLIPHARSDRFHRFSPLVAALGMAQASLRGFTPVFLRTNDEARRAIDSLPSSLRSRCRVCGDIPRNDVFGWLARSRAILRPSLSDGTPNVMLEAMAAGALPVMSPLASVREWIDDGVNGLLAANDDADALARAVSRACVDDDLVSRAADTNAAIAAERADRRVMRKRVLALYERLRDGCAGPSDVVLPESEPCVSL